MNGKVEMQRVRKVTAYTSNQKEEEKGQDWVSEGQRSALVSSIPLEAHQQRLAVSLTAFQKIEMVGIEWKQGEESLGNYNGGSEGRGSWWYLRFHNQRKNKFSVCVPDISLGSRCPSSFQLQNVFRVTHTVPCNCQMCEVDLCMVKRRCLDTQGERCHCRNQWLLWLHLCWEFMWKSWTRLCHMLAMMALVRIGTMERRRKEIHVFWHAKGRSILGWRWILYYALHFSLSSQL